MAVHFISDLHLQPGRPNLTALAHRYLSHQAHEAEAVYILGDLFEYWIGDDGSMRDYKSIIKALSDLTAAGIPVYFMRGNRDFAVGETFAAATGIRLLPDPTIIDLYGTSSVLTHGDRLCTDDHAHQQFRARYTDPEWLQRMLRLPVFIRRFLALYARWRSKQGKQNKPEAIMDVNADAVATFMANQHADRLIHGHTHRPADHQLDDQKHRLVLSDWHDTHGEVLICNQQGWHRLSLT